MGCGLISCQRSALILIDNYQVRFKVISLDYYFMLRKKQHFMAVDAPMV